jgi:hypothetical protein
VIDINDPVVAARLLRAVDTRVDQRLTALVPRIAYGVVDAVDSVNRRASVYVDGAASSTPGFPYPPRMALATGQAVRVVIRPGGDHYIEQVLTGTGQVAVSYVGTTSPTTPGIDMLQRTQYARQVVLAEPGFLASIDAYIAGAPSNVNNISAMVFTDASGTPSKAIAPSPGNRIADVFLSTTYRWYSMPVAVWLPAGTYWLAVMQLSVGPTSNFKLGAVAGGTDKLNTATGDWWTENGTWTAPGNTYSIRGTVLR